VVVPYCTVLYCTAVHTTVVCVCLHMYVYMYACMHACVEVVATTLVSGSICRRGSGTHLCVCGVHLRMHMHGGMEVVATALFTSGDAVSVRCEVWYYAFVYLYSVQVEKR